MKKYVIIGIITILTFSLTGCDWFQPAAPADEQPAVTDEQTEMEEVTSEDDAAVEEETVAIDEEPVAEDETAVEEEPASEEQTDFPQFDTMDEYVELVLNESKNDEYLTDKPADFDRIKFGGQGEGVEVGPDGVPVSVYVLGESDWDVGNLEDIDPFYLEVIRITPCFDVDCVEEETVDYYGPFQGKLKLLVQ